MTETSDFIIGRHKTSSRHYDLVLGINGTSRHLIVPGGIPKKFGEKRIAIEENAASGFFPTEEKVQTAEDSWGKGKWEIWDRGSYETETSNSIKLVIRPSGEKFMGRYLFLVPGWGRWTGKRLWVIEKIKERSL